MTDPLPLPGVGPTYLAEVIRRSLLIADRAVIADIETEGVRVDLPEGRWWDVRPMLDDREHSPPVVDMAREALQYARMRGLVAHHPDHAHLVRLTPKA